MNQTPPGGGPTVLRMILGRQLQALREKAGMSYDQAAAAIYSSSYTIRRMERAEGGLKALTVKSLLMAYGITDVREIDAFLALARDAVQARLVAQLRRRAAVLVPHVRRPGRSRQPHPRIRPALGTWAAADPRLRAGQRPDRVPGRGRGRSPAAGGTAAGPPAHPGPARPAAAVAGPGREHAAPPGRHHRAKGHARPDRQADRRRRPAEHHHPGAAVRGRAAPGHVRAVPAVPVRRATSSPTSSTASP